MAPRLSPFTRTSAVTIPRQGCNTPDITFLICTPTLAISGVKLYLFPWVRVLSPCVVIVLMHLLSCHHVHCICIRVRLMHPSIFPVVRFAFRRSYLLRCPFCLFSCVGLKHLRIGPRLVMRPWFTTGRPPVKFRTRLCLILQWLTEGPRRPRFC